MKIILTYKISIFSIMMLLAAGSIFSAEYEVHAKIESLRKGNLITILFSQNPYQRNYYISNNDILIGRIDILKILPPP